MDVEELIQRHPEVSAELIRSTARMAERDADDLAAFFRRCEESSGEKMPPMSMMMLLVLGVFARFKRWESRAIRVHIDAGLPTANQLFVCVTAAAKAPRFEEFVLTTFRLANALFYEHFVWMAAADSSVELAMSVSVNDDQLLDAVADFLLETTPNAEAK